MGLSKNLRYEKPYTIKGGMCLSSIHTGSKEIPKDTCKDLNENTNDDLQFFAVEVQAIQINNSLPAPLFKVKASPNEWTKSNNVKRIIGKNEVSEKEKYYKKFFTCVLEKLSLNLPNYTNSKRVSYKHYRKFPSGNSAYKYAISFRKGNKISVEVYIDTGNNMENKDAFSLLYESKDEIEGALGKLSWEELENKKGCRIAIYADITDNDEEMVDWSVKTLIKFIKIFKAYIN